MVVRLLHRGMALVCLPAVLGCASGEHAVRVPTAVPATQPDSQPSSLTMDEIKAGLEDLPVWPYAQRDFTPREWVQIVEFAYRLQHTDPDTVLTALREYTQVPGAEAPGNYVGKWSKVYILLRVLFDVPSERYNKHKHALPPITGGGFMPAFRSRRACDRLESVLSRPILWTKRGPRLFSSYVGYNGKPYNVEWEWLQYREHYRYRSLDDALKLLRIGVADEEQDR